MIEAEKLKKSYKGKIVLEISSLIIKKSEIVSICGPSGAGKTTLLNILGTLMKTDNLKETSLKIMGEDITKMSSNNPSIIFADEPSGNLDAKNADELHKLFFKLRDEFGQTFVIVTHNEKLSKISDRIIKLVDGKIQSK